MELSPLPIPNLLQVNRASRPYMGTYGRAKEEYQKPRPIWAEKVSGSGRYAIYGCAWAREKFQK